MTPGIDPTATFTPLSIALLTVSSSRTEETDPAGRALAERLEGAGHRLAARLILREDRALVEAQLRAWIANPTVDVVIAVGGTGLTPRDVTTDAFEAAYDKDLPAFGEQVRAIGARSLGLSVLGSRPSGGVAKATFLFALPASAPLCREVWDELLGPQLDSRYRPEGLASLLPLLSS